MATAGEVVVNSDERVVLNVGGARYEVLLSTLARYPNTLLGTLFRADNPNRMQPDKKGEYFFDRNPQIFDMILNFYRTGKLVIPADTPQDVLHEELSFFQIEFDDPNAEEEDEDAKIRKQPKEKQYEHSLSLLHNNKRKDIKRGLGIINELLLLNETEIPLKDCLFYKALGHYRLNEITTAKVTLQKLLDVNIDPQYTQARTLMVLLEDTKQATVYVGAGFVTLILSGIVGYLKLKHVW